MNKDLQEVLNEVQWKLSTYRSLPKRKRLKRKNFEAYKRLILKEMALKEAMNVEMTAHYVGGEPKMEVCDIEENL